MQTPLLSQSHEIYTVKLAHFGLQVPVNILVYFILFAYMLALSFFLPLPQLRKYRHAISSWGKELSPPWISNYLVLYKLGFLMVSRKIFLAYFSFVGVGRMLFPASYKLGRSRTILLFIYLFF